MPHLLPQDRDALPDSALGLPQTRAHPMPNVALGHHARARAAEEFNAGKLAASDSARIDRKADHIFGNEA